MAGMWPWLAMGLGVFALIIYPPLKRIMHPLNFEKKFSKSRFIFKRRPSHDWVSILISLLILLPALYIILWSVSYSYAQPKWAFGAVGMIFGYWIKR